MAGIQSRCVGLSAAGLDPEAGGLAGAEDVIALPEGSENRGWDRGVAVVAGKPVLGRIGKLRCSAASYTPYNSCKLRSMYECIKQGQHVGAATRVLYCG